MKNEKFEEAYRRLFPISCQVQPHLFALDDFGDYKDGRVFVAEKLREDAHRSHEVKSST